MKGDYELEEEIDIKEKHWKEAISGKINSLKIKLLKKDEELKIYKERIKDIENAFCYNLNLLSDRDIELDALENQLQLKVEQIERLIFLHNESENAIVKLENERQRDVKLFQSQLIAKEQQISQLEKKNRANVNTLKQTIEDVKIEYEEKISKLIWAFDNQKKDVENHFQMIVDANAQKNLKDMKEITKQIKTHIDLINKEKEKVVNLEARNYHLMQEVAIAEKEFKEKEESLLQKVEELTKRYNKVNRELQNRKIKKQVDHKESFFKPEVKSVYTQTDVDVVQEYSVRSPPEKDKNPCKECLNLTAEIKESNRNLQKEITDLKNIVKDDRLQKAEEESIIQNLEISVYSLKEKLMSELLKKNFEVNENSSEQEILSYTYNKEIENQIRITLFEQQFNKKLETLMSSAQEERQLFLAKIEEMKRECVDKIESFRKQTEFVEANPENVVSKIRHEIDLLENKIRNNFKDIIENKNKQDKSLQVSLVNKDENPYKMKSVAETVLITPDNKYWIIPNRDNLPKEKHIVVQGQKNCTRNDNRRGRTSSKVQPQVLPRCSFLQKNPFL